MARKGSLDDLPSTGATAVWTCLVFIATSVCCILVLLITRLGK